jgi:hypothetical protein
LTRCEINYVENGMSFHLLELHSAGNMAVYGGHPASLPHRPIPRQAGRRRRRLSRRRRRHQYPRSRGRLDQLRGGERLSAEIANPICHPPHSAKVTVVGLPDEERSETDRALVGPKPDAPWDPTTLWRSRAQVTAIRLSKPMAVRIVLDGLRVLPSSAWGRSRTPRAPRQRSRRAPRRFPAPSGSRRTGRTQRRR